MLQPGVSSYPSDNDPVTSVESFFTWNTLMVPYPLKIKKKCSLNKVSFDCERKEVLLVKRQIAQL